MTPIFASLTPLQRLVVRLMGVPMMLCIILGILVADLASGEVGDSSREILAWGAFGGAFGGMMTIVVVVLMARAMERRFEAMEGSGERVRIPTALLPKGDRESR